MRNTFNLISGLINELFEPEDRRLQRATTDLLNRHLERTKASSDGFMYMGRAYVDPTSSAPLGSPKRTLHVELWDDMAKHLDDFAQVDHDRHRIKQLLARLYDPCFCEQDFRCATPHAISPLLPEELRALSWQRDPTFFLRHQRDHRLYADVLPRIELYAAARLIY